MQGAPGSGTRGVPGGLARARFSPNADAHAHAGAHADPKAEADPNALEVG